MQVLKHAHVAVSQEQLQDLPLFRQLPASVLQALLGLAEWVELEDAEVLLSPFKANQHLYVLLNGQLNVHLGSLDHPPVDLIAPGACVGEVSALDLHLPSAYVVALGNCQIVRWQREDLMRLMAQIPQLMHNLFEWLCTRLRQGNRLIQDSDFNAKIDPLTGCYNRRWLEQVFAREQTRCAYNERALSLLMLDVDYFKEYNDTHGHLAGDYALCMVANTLREQLRPKDSLVRYGGEEFVVLLPELSLIEATTIGERLRQCLEQVNAYYSPLGPLPGVTISLGVAQMQTGHGLDQLIADADRALYRAKLQGRNCVCQ